MDKTYNFNDPDEMIDLALRVQTEVYWGGHFVDDEDENVQFQYFWEYAQTARSEGCTQVRITKCKEVTFMKEVN